MTSSLCCAEVPQAVLLTICSWSPVCLVISVYIIKTLFMSHSNVHLIPWYVFLPAVWKLTIVQLLFSWTFFFLCKVFSHIFCLCFFPTRNFCFLNLTISLRFPPFLSLLFLALISPSQHFPLVSPSVTSVSQSQSFPSPVFPKEAIFKD